MRSERFLKAPAESQQAARQFIGLFEPQGRLLFRNSERLINEASRYTGFHKAASGQSGHLDELSQLLSEELFNPNKAHPTTGLTALHVAAYRGNLPALNRLAESSRTDLHAVDKLGLTALHWAILGGQIEAVKALVRKGIRLGPVRTFGHSEFVRAVGTKSSRTPVGLKNGQVKRSSVFPLRRAPFLNVQNAYLSFAQDTIRITGESRRQRILSFLTEHLKSQTRVRKAGQRAPTPAIKPFSKRPLF